ncbi:hypothetical protein OQA88_12536 [Cercophora sp. LCS_1]
MASFKDMPLELVAMTLQHLDSMGDLGSAILAHRGFSNAVQATHSSIPRAILRNRLDEDWLVFASAMFLAKQIPRFGQDGRTAALGDFIARYFDQPASLMTEDVMCLMSKDDVAEIIEMCDAIDFLAERCLRAGFQEWMGMKPAHDRPSSFTPSESEFDRMRFAFIHIEIFSRLFNDEDGMDPAEQIEAIKRRTEINAFLAKLQPWEREQVCVAHDYMKRIYFDLLPMDFSQSDYDALTGEEQPAQQEVFSRWIPKGVVAARRCLSMLEGREHSNLTRPALLDRLHRKIGGPLKFRQPQLVQSIALAPPVNNNPSILVGYTPAEEMDLLSQALHEDRAAADVWYIAHLLCAASEWAGTPYREEHRRLCYVLWDENRMREYELEDVLIHADKYGTWLLGARGGLLGDPNEELSYAPIVSVVLALIAVPAAFRPAVVDAIMKAVGYTLSVIIAAPPDSSTGLVECYEAWMIRAAKRVGGDIKGPRSWVEQQKTGGEHPLFAFPRSDSTEVRYSRATTKSVEALVGELYGGLCRRLKQFGFIDVYAMARLADVVDELAGRMMRKAWGDLRRKGAQGHEAAQDNGQDGQDGVLGQVEHTEMRDLLHAASADEGTQIQDVAYILPEAAESATRGPTAAAALELSETEWFRARRAFYQFELLCRLFGGIKARESGLGEFEDDAFLKHHSYWENEQIACALDYLEVVYAEEEAWMSEGLLHIHNVVNKKSWDKKEKLLHVRKINPGCQVFRALESMSNYHRFADPDDNTDPKPFTSDEMDALWPPRPAENTGFVRFRSGDEDEGPHHVWRHVHRDLDRWTFIIHPDTYRHRIRASVLWDWERVVNYQLLSTLDEVE